MTALSSCSASVGETDVFEISRENRLYVDEQYNKKVLAFDTYYIKQNFLSALDKETCMEYFHKRMLSLWG